MGQFAEVLHMPPREVRELTVDEFDTLEDYLRQRDEAIREANRG